MNNNALVADENQMRCLLWAARLARKFHVACARARQERPEETLKWQISSQSHEVAFDFSLWDFCPWVRTAWSFVALARLNNLNRNPSHCFISNRSRQASNQSRATYTSLLAVAAAQTLQMNYLSTADWMDSLDYKVESVSGVSELLKIRWQSTDCNIADAGRRSIHVRSIVFLTRGLFEAPRSRPIRDVLITHDRNFIKARGLRASKPVWQWYADQRRRTPPPAATPRAARHFTVHGLPRTHSTMVDFAP